MATYSSRRVSVTTTATAVLAANGNRVGASIINRGTGSVYDGPDNTVTAADQAEVAPGEALELGGETATIAVWMIAASGSQRVDVREFIR